MWAVAKIYIEFLFPHLLEEVEACFLFFCGLYPSYARILESSERKMYLSIWHTSRIHPYIEDFGNTYEWLTMEGKSLNEF